MKIISLVAENFKRLSAIEITPKGNVVKITGKNANGKSSVLDSIWSALGGKDNVPDKPIRDGEKTGEIKVDLGDLLVTRKFTEKGTSLTVSNKDGALYQKPQSVLDELIGRLSFDPMHFMHIKPSDQFITLAEHAGVDFTSVDAERKTAFDERTIVNRDGKAKKAEVDAMALTYDENAPDEEVSVSDLVSKVTEANESNRKLKSLDDLINNTASSIKSKKEQIASLEQQVKDAQISLSDLRKQVESMEEIDISDIQKQIDNAEETNTAVRAKTRYKEEFEKLEFLRANTEKLVNVIKKCDETRAKMIADAKLPVEGLGFGDGFVTFNGIPLDQTSSSEQLKVSISVAMSMNPKLKVIRIQDGSLLDSDAMKVIEEMAKEKDFQFWVEQVDESGKVGIVIEDGHVVADNQ